MSELFIEFAIEFMQGFLFNAGDIGARDAEFFRNFPLRKHLFAAEAIAHFDDEQLSLCERAG